MPATILANSHAFSEAFSTGCNTSDRVYIFVAWAGKYAPMPYGHLKKEVIATVGIDMHQTHPEGLAALMEMGADLRIVRPAQRGIFHPKVYIFEKNGMYEMLTGSSNFSHSAFLVNQEFNIRIFGDENQAAIRASLEQLKQFRDDETSFIPDEKWLKKYRKEWEKRQNTLSQTAEGNDEVGLDNAAIAAHSWLESGTWDTYRLYLEEGKRHQPDQLDNALDMLDLYQRTLALPWTLETFSPMEHRNILWGEHLHGRFGHVGASGRIRKLLANGTPKEQKAIVDVINYLCRLNGLINYEKMRMELTKLTKLKPTMKVWGRFLAIMRPDLYCTISSEGVRKSLSGLLKKPRNYFATVDGYVTLLEIVHQSPWFNSPPPPIETTEYLIWKNRVILLDFILYDETNR